MIGASEATPSRIEDIGQELPAGVPYVQCGSEGRAWLVLEGRLDLFLARRDADSGVFIRRHRLLRVSSGEFLFDLMEISAARGRFTPIFTPGAQARCAAFDARRLDGRADAAESKRLREGLAHFNSLLGEGAEKIPAPAFSQSFADNLQSAREFWREILAERVARFGEGEAFPAAPLPSEFELACLRRAVAKRAASQPGFREKFMSNPRAAAAEVLGRSLPDNFKLRLD
ncbi:MAG TPA: hypothetical protein VNH15_00440 [Elusimicrobiota bacterium]|nr:hypothetical protein [Elusimicrobiota bacterium]